MFEKITVNVDLLTNISLFSGAGGLELGARLVGGFKTVAYVENDPYAQGVIMSRMRDGSLDDAPIFEDVRTFRGASLRGSIDVVSAGFPCQPHSVAGKRGGAEDPRNLWPDTVRVLRESGAWIFLGENVPGIISSGYAATVLADLEEAGFCATPFSNSSCSVGAPHARQRVFFVAHSIGLRRWRRNPVVRRSGNSERKPLSSVGGNSGIVYSTSSGDARDYGREDSTWRKGEPSLDRVVDGLAFGMERLRCVGNGVDPFASIPAWRRIKEIAQDLALK